MVKTTAIIKNQKGIHARPSSMVSIESQKYNSIITLSYDGKSASSKDVLQIIILELFQGVEVEVIAEGDDEEAAAAAVKELLEREYEFD